MSNKDLCKGKHLIIEYGLDQNYTLKEIAEIIKKDPTTISKEIKRNRFLKVNKRKKGYTTVPTSKKLHQNKLMY